MTFLSRDEWKCVELLPFATLRPPETQFLYEICVKLSVMRDLSHTLILLSLLMKNGGKFILF